MKQQIVLVIPTNTIGVVIDKGLNPNGSIWYRTDCDGVREKHELVFLFHASSIESAIDAGAQIAPSTKDLIGISHD